MDWRVFFLVKQKCIIHLGLSIFLDVATPVVGYSQVSATADLFVAPHKWLELPEFPSTKTHVFLKFKKPSGVYVFIFGICFVGFTWANCLFRLVCNWHCQGY